MTNRDESPSSTHPPLPPTSEDEQFHRLRLLRSRRVGISTYYRMLAEHGTAQNALVALPEVARTAGVKNYEICPAPVIEAELRTARTMDAFLISRGSACYPKALEDLRDAPPFLWAMGHPECLQKPMIAIVGARNASSLGSRMTKKLACELGEAGYIVVSGMARGIDTAAHLATLKTGTIAVLGGGVDVIYPAENAELASGIACDGLRISEQPMGLQPMARHFPARNRIISGLSMATVVVEAAAKSGSLITARDALDLGRDVFAVPGHPFDARASGCNMLIRDGALLIRSAEDVLEAITPFIQTQQERVEPTPASKTPDKRSKQQTFALHQEILQRLGPTPMAEDQLIRDLNAHSSTVTPVLVELELDGQIDRQAGGLLSRVT
ncbi:MAG: DNA-processing protein DprA [Paracoccaceae bacterium]